ncbi:MAG: GGDEF domain-containing protein [Nitrospirota bacterium]
MKDRLKIYLFLVSVLFLIIYLTSEHLAKKIDEEVELYNQHVSLLYNSHEVLYHITAIQEGIYSLEYGTIDSAEPIKAHLKSLEQGIEGISNGISYIFYARGDDDAFKGYVNNSEAIQNLYPKFKVQLNEVVSAVDARERRKHIEETIEITERMEYFLNEIDKYMDGEHTAVKAFLPTITTKMRWIRNITGILFFCVIVILSVMFFYSCKSFRRMFPYLNAIKGGIYDVKVELGDTPCERALQSTINTMLERVKDFEKSSSELTIIDSLTGAYNRRYFDIRINEEMSRYSRHGTIFSLSLIDIDHFKNVNDTLGHQVGDLALKELVTLIKETVRDTDMVARYGGEEFAIISPYTPKSGVLTLVERLRDVVEKNAFTSLGRPLTISIGVADSAGKNTTEQIIGEADSSLYIAKNSGRNICVIGGVTA